MQELDSKSYNYAKFNGTTGQYYRIWLVNIILTIFSVGIYSAWAKVRKLKFFLGSTEYEGSYFDFHGSPIAILRGRIILVVMFIVYLGVTRIDPLAIPISGFMIYLFIPFLIVKSLEFRLRYTSYRNLRFSFRGKFKEAYKIWFKFFIFPLAMVLISSYLAAQVGITNGKEKMTPAQVQQLMYSFIPNLIAFLYFVFMFHRIFNAIISFIFNNIFYGDTQLSMNSDKSQVLKEVYLKWLKIFFISSVTFIFLLACVIFGVQYFKLLNAKMTGVITGISFVLVYLSFGISFLYFNFLTLRYIWSRVTIGEKYSCVFNLNFKEYFQVLFTNIIILIFTFGLAYPYTAVRFQRMLIEARGSDIDNFDDFSGSDLESKSAYGEEISEGLDLGFEFGL